MTNVVRHAHARCCVVEVAATSDRIVLTVRDDGDGRAKDAPLGVGTLSMRERAEELGGTLSVTDAPSGGTVVTAQLPWREEASHDPHPVGR